MYLDVQDQEGVLVGQLGGSGGQGSGGRSVGEYEILVCSKVGRSLLWAKRVGPYRVQG